MPPFYSKKILLDEKVSKHPLAIEIISRCKNSTIINVKLDSCKNDEEILLKFIPHFEDLGDIKERRLFARDALLLYDNSEIIQTMTKGPNIAKCCHNFRKIIPYIGVCKAECEYCWFIDKYLIPKVNVCFF